jgi:transcriptional regulator with XRE-family HTH domain
MKEKIKAIMEKERITTTEMAKKIGVSKGAVSQWVTGRAVPTATHEKRIAHEFRWLNIYWLWGMEDNMSREVSIHDMNKRIIESQRLIALYEKLFKLKNSS